MVVLPWTRHVRAGRDLLRRAFEAANKVGDLTYAAYCGNELTTNLLAAGDPLAEVQREAEHGLAFAQKARFGFVIDCIATQLGLIRTLRGLTPTFGAFDDAQFDERRIERRFSENPGFGAWPSAGTGCASCRRASLPAIMRRRSRPRRGRNSFCGHRHRYFETAEYQFYGALVPRRLPATSASAGQRQQHLDAVAAHPPANSSSGRRIAQTISRTVPPWSAPRSRASKAASSMPSASTNRPSARPAPTALFTMRRSPTNWPPASTRRVASRRLPVCICGTPATAICVGAPRARCGNSISSIRNCRQDERAPGPAGTIGAPVEHLDLATVMKVSQAVSGEIVLEKLLDTLMRTAIEQAGAERGLLILARGAEQRIEAEATTSGDTVVVRLCDEAVAGAALPESVLHYVLRTREGVILDDAAAENDFSADPYIRQHGARSILCLPLLNQAKLIGVLYLENNLAPRVFAPARIAVLKLLASQAAVALENTRLYRDLAEREAKIRRLVEANIIGIFIFALDGRIIEANDAFLQMVGYDREDLVSGRIRWTDLTPPEWRDRDARAVAEVKLTGSRAALREGVYPQGRQPRARADRRGDVRGRWRRGCRLRARSDRAQAGGSRSARERAALPRDADGAGAREPRRDDGAAHRLDRP